MGQEDNKWYLHWAGKSWSFDSVRLVCMVIAFFSSQGVNEANPVTWRLGMDRRGDVWLFDLGLRWRQGISEDQNWFKIVFRRCPAQLVLERHAFYGRSRHDPRHSITRVFISALSSSSHLMGSQEKGRMVRRVFTISLYLSNSLEKQHCFCWVT